MSFDLFVTPVRNGDTATFRRSVFEEIFTREALEPSSPLNNVRYPDGSSAEIYGCEADDIDGVMFTHFGGETVFSLIIELAERTGSMIFWPDTRPALAVTRASVIDHIPADCVATIGPAKIVSDARELMDYIARPE
jgi:hypothetical protein